MLLITGASGFIGTNLYKSLHKKYEIIATDKKSFVQLPNLKEGKNRIVFQQADLRDKDQVWSLFNRYPIKQIVHLAAESHVDKSIESPEEFWTSNVVGTSNLLEMALEYKVEIVINQITDEVYGEKPQGEALEGNQFYPTSPYPCSKASQYWVGKSSFTTYGLPVVSTFPVNCFGPYQDSSKLIPKFLYKLKIKEKLPLMESTHFERDWLPVEDMCYAHEVLLEKGIAGEDYNVGADNHHTNEALTKKLLAGFNKTWGSSVKIIKDRKAHDSRYAVNSDKIKKLGWACQNTFDNYLNELIERSK